MPSAKEMRYWLILGLLILWGGLVALAWDVWQGWRLTELGFSPPQAAPFEWER
jgi:hypothetical protein